MDVMAVASPCIGVCVVNLNRICQGCFRTLDEIAGWSTASDVEKQRILNEVSKRPQAADKANGVKADTKLAC